MLWKLLYGDKVIGWSHCGYQFEYSSFLDDGVGLAVIEAEFNYIYIKPEYRNQSFSYQFGWQIGVATANHIPFDLFNEEIKDIETSIPLTLEAHAFCLNIQGKLAATTFAEGLHNKLSHYSHKSPYFLVPERQDFFNDDQFVLPDEEFRI